VKRPAYRVEYAAEAEEHLKALSARDATTVLLIGGEEVELR
jgi:hypothetical protein